MTDVPPLTTETGIYERRLLNAVRAVLEGQPENFSMRRFAFNCGTPSCVLGHYVARGDLQDVFRLDRTDNWPRIVGNDAFAGCDHSAIQHHFGITRAEAGELFSTEGCGFAQTPQEAADYILKFIGRKWPALGADFAAFRAASLTALERTT